MEKPFVLIVEDERDIAALFRHVMDLAGYRTELEANGVLAMERLATTQPDVVLLDLSLPGISGVNILQRMRLDERLKNIPVVVVTAYAELADNLSVEPDLIMLKPVSAVQLTDLVQRLAHDSKRMETAPFGATPWDEVTGLYNRAFFLHRLDSAIQNVKDKNQNLYAVIAISPDRYELISHERGPRQADAFAKLLGETLRGCIRPTDTIARFDLDRFFILVEQAPGLHIPEMIGARIKLKLDDKPAELTGDRLTSCIGILRCDANYRNVDEVLADARAAYIRARAAGPGSCLTFDRDTLRTGVTPG